MWHFCSVDDMKKVEKVQYCAIKCIYNELDSPYSVFRKKGQRPHMYIEGLNEMLVEYINRITRLIPNIYMEMSLKNSQNIIYVI